MAITKIHPIKSTLNFAIDYITNEDKTDEKILVSSYLCHPITAHTAFIKTREDSNTSGSVLARHLIQSFYPGETTPEKAHEIGQVLCKKVLKNEYQYVLSTHVDKGHIHNHIIFNNVNSKTGKCYQSNKRSYHRIRFQSDTLCKENNLSVIDEYYEAYKRKYKTNGKSWYENEQHKRGTSWKSKLQFDIDRLIKQSRDWDEFLSNMGSKGYEIKQGKHIAFKHKDKERFSRAKTIGEDYTEERIKERIVESTNTRSTKKKSRVKKVIDVESNPKVKELKGYEFWAKKHNLKIMANSVIFLREQGIKSVAQLDVFIQKGADKRQELQDKIKLIDDKSDYLSLVMEHAHTIKQFKEIYKYHKENPSDTQFENEYSREISLYKVAATNLLETYKKLPDTREILAELDSLQEKKNTLMKEYSDSKTNMDDLFTVRKNFEQYLGKEIER